LKSGSSTANFTLLPALFKIDPYALIYQVSVTITATTSQGINSGTSSLFFYANQLPTGGLCFITPSTGIALSTNFTLACDGWSDPDGVVTQYQYFGNFSRNKAYIPNYKKKLFLI
jgi:hypothetical protein